MPSELQVRSYLVNIERKGFRDELQRLDTTKRQKNFDVLYNLYPEPKSVVGLAIPEWDRHYIYDCGVERARETVFKRGGHVPYVRRRKFKNLHARDPRCQFQRGAPEHNPDFERFLSKVLARIRGRADHYRWVASREEAKPKEVPKRPEEPEEAADDIIDDFEDIVFIEKKSSNSQERGPKG